MEQVTQKRGRGTLGWIVRFAGRRKGSYIASVILAVLNVICGFIPFIYLANITRGLLEKTADFHYCLTQCLWMAVFFVLSRLFHAFSTTFSHRATFEVLANVRRMLTGKLVRMPLGDVLDESSGTYKNIIVERVDSIETTLAHMIPELTSNIIIPFVIFGYILRNRPVAPDVRFNIAFRTVFSVIVPVVRQAVLCPVRPYKTSSGLNTAVLLSYS